MGSIIKHEFFPQRRVQMPKSFYKTVPFFSFHQLNKQSQTCNAVSLEPLFN